MAYPKGCKRCNDGALKSNFDAHSIGLSNLSLIFLSHPRGAVHSIEARCTDIDPWGKGYDADAVRRKLRVKSVISTVPAKGFRRWSNGFQPRLHRNRKGTEQMFGQIRGFCGIAPRYGRLARTFFCHHKPRRYRLSPIWASDPGTIRPNTSKVLEKLPVWVSPKPKEWFRITQSGGLSNF